MVPLAPETEAAATKLQSLWQATQDALLVRLADAVTSPRARPRLRALLSDVDAELAALRTGTGVWLTTDMPAVYTRGATATAEVLGARYVPTLTIHREAVQALAERSWAAAAQTLTDVTVDTKRTIRGMLNEATRRQILEGIPGPTASRAFTAALQEETGLLTVRYSNGARHGIADYGDTLARTDAAMAHNAGGFGQSKSEGVTHMECFDGAGCCLGPGHKNGPLANGLVLPIEEAESHSLSHPRCVMPDSPTTIYGEIIEMVRARYSGPCHRITFAAPSGNYHLAVGPNHPVLTGSGWKAAHLIREGDELVYDRWHDDSSDVGMELHLDQVPRAEDLFDALWATGDRSRVAGSSDDLHGDGRFVEGEVDVVRPARCLLVEGHPTVAEQTSQHELVGADACLELVPAGGGHNTLFPAVSTSPGRFVGSGGLLRDGSTASAFLHPVPPVDLGLGDRPGDTQGSEPSSHFGAPMAESFTDLVAGESVVDVPTAQLVIVPRDAPALGGAPPDAGRVTGLDLELDAAPLAGHPRASTLDVIHGAGVGTEPALPLDRKGALAELAGLRGSRHVATPVKVVAVERGWHDGFVYDVTTTAGVFGGTGCIIKNCARSWSARPDVASAEQAEGARRFSPDEQAAMAAEENARAARANVDSPRGTFAADRPSRQPRAERTPRTPRAPRQAR